MGYGREGKQTSKLAAETLGFKVCLFSAMFPHQIQQFDSQKTTNLCSSQHIVTLVTKGEVSSLPGSLICRGSSIA